MMECEVVSLSLSLVKISLNEQLIASINQVATVKTRQRYEMQQPYMVYLTGNSLLRGSKTKCNQSIEETNTEKKESRVKDTRTRRPRVGNTSKPVHVYRTQPSSFSEAIMSLATYYC